MIDNLILYFKHFPSLLKFAKQRLFNTWKWFAYLFLAQLILVVILLLCVSFLEIEEIVKAQWLYRLTTLITFISIVSTIYKAYMEYSRDYLITKSFQLTPLVTAIMNIIMGNIVIWVLSFIIAIFKPTNLETSVISYLFFALMCILFMIFIVVTLGLLDLISNKVTKLFMIVSAICFFLVPIIYIPSTKFHIINQILKINPMYYLLDGSASSVIFGAVNMYNIAYHIYFIIFLVLLGTINFMLVRYVAHEKYKYTNHTQNVKDDTQQQVK
ncbi:teichoic acid transporter [Staphylococcus pragensis]|uniref:Teichoic acid transporter n=2 Tax=Staphylococcus TaxID=1279 RepID=A0A4Z1B625_9STAP|nr:teichoic acid transporter [Staphylococcus carnosus]TGN26496.1 teichoic acid transporter [Staphylococcus pragensis]